MGDSMRVELGRTVVDASGRWVLSSMSDLADGAYAVTAEAVGDGSILSATLHPLAAPLVIDTRGPQIERLAVAFRVSRLQLRFVDAGSGLDMASLDNGAHYQVANRKARGGWRVLPFRLALDGSLGGTLRTVVTLQSRAGRRLATQNRVTVSGMIRDLAGNGLDGAFLRRWPSGNGISGTPFDVIVRNDGVRVIAIVPADQGGATRRRR
jgi:hypothetical protein